MSLRRFVAGEMTWRELRDFVANLPPDSATSRAIHGEAASWTATTHMVASLIDVYIGAHTPKGKTAPTVPRPDN